MKWQLVWQVQICGTCPGDSANSSISCLGYLFFSFSLAGGASVTVLTLDDALGGNREEMPHRFARFPARLCAVAWTKTSALNFALSPIVLAVGLFSVPSVSRFFLYRHSRCPSLPC